MNDVNYLFENKTKDEIVENSKYYFSVFSDIGMVGFRGQKFDDDDCVDILLSISQNAHWSPVHDSRRGTWKYVQNHDRQVSSIIRDDVNSDDKLLIQWHMEGSSKKMTQHAAGWNMRHFKCSDESGTTGFVDMSKLIHKIPEKYIDLINNAEVIHIPILYGSPENPSEFMEQFREKSKLKNGIVWTLDGNEYVSSYPRRAIEIHGTTGESVLRVCPCEAHWGIQDILYSVGENIPKQQDYELFDDFLKWMKFEIEEVGENQIWHSWKENDFIIPDLFKMAHGVRAGFQPGDREFDGFWCFPVGTSPQPDERITLEQYEQMEKENGSQYTVGN
jgi:alpha-ketoglutarate-dependent taurine dioxygenase